MVLYNNSDELLITNDPNGWKYGDWIIKKDCKCYIVIIVTSRFCSTNVRLSEGVKELG